VKLKMVNFGAGGGGGVVLLLHSVSYVGTHAPVAHIRMANVSAMLSNENRFDYVMPTGLCEYQTREAPPAGQ
jgi:hypothetical protein